MTSCITHPPYNPMAFSCQHLLQKADNDGVGGFVLGLFQQRHLKKKPILLNQSQIEKETFYLVKDEALRNRLARMADSGLLVVERFDPEQAALLCSQRPYLARYGTILDLEIPECKWCQSPSLLLHSHHYPIPKSHGGTDTVTICPQCPGEFHFLVATRFYRPSSGLLSWFNNTHQLRLEGGDVVHLSKGITCDTVPQP